MQRFGLAPSIAGVLQPLAVISKSTVAHPAKLPVVVAVSFHPDFHLFGCVYDFSGRQ
jgi:hypothetical protein